MTYTSHAPSGLKQCSNPCLFLLPSYLEDTVGPDFMTSTATKNRVQSEIFAKAYFKPDMRLKSAAPVFLIKPPESTIALDINSSIPDDCIY